MKRLPRNRVVVGDAAEVLAGLLPESVDCLVTSPPYAGGVRNYGHPEQLGQEGDVDSYVAAVTAVLRRARRVLKSTGTAWLNVGDVYSRHPRHGAPAKSLLLAPQRLAVALAADGWIIRNHVVWAKINALPQSAGDRLSPTWESLLLLAKSTRYFFDLSAIRTPHASTAIRRPTEAARRYQGGNGGLAALKARGLVGHPDGKNPGDVWTTATAIDRLGHQATFPEALIERPIRAGCPEAICVQCDEPWTRPVRWQRIDTSEGRRNVRRVGELRRCDCFAPWRSGVVLDPFFGSGTVGVVAERLRRDWLGIELHRPYARLAEQRIAGRRAA